MRKSIIEEMFYDNECFGEKVKMSEEYNKRNKESIGLYEQLLEVLDEKQKKLFDEFANSEIGVCAETEFIHFKEGLKIGLQLAMECLS